MKFALLLCTYNVEARKSMYHDVIRWWMKNSTLDIYIIDSSNNVFDDDIEQSCKTHHFNQADFTSCTTCSTTLEFLSYDQALNVFGKEWENNYDYIIKLTCKYTLPTLEAILKEITDTSYDLFIQRIGSRSHTNCEIYIIKSTKIDLFINDLRSVTPHCSLEHRLHKNLSKYAFSRLKRMQNTSNYKRGCGNILRSL